MARWLTITFLLALTACHRPLSQSVYVWQRQASPELNQAITETSADFQRFYFQAAHLDFRMNPPGVQKFEIPWDALKQTRRPIIPVVRIPSAHPALGSSPDAARHFAEFARELFATASRKNVSLGEIQIDYDCPASQLSNYARFLRGVRAELRPIRLSITALPSWLRDPGFKELIDSVDSYVLQVHSLELPSPGERTVSLCGLPAARAAIQRAAQFGVSFQVALPTYRCLVTFDPNGKSPKVFSETPPNWTPSQRIVRAISDAGELAELVRSLQKHPPRNLQGVIWFRLPVSTDLMNWPLSTLRAVMAGNSPRSELRIEPVPRGESLLLELANHGEQAEPLPDKVTVQWSAGSLQAANALGGFQLLRPDKEPQLIFQLAPATTPFREINPGQRRVIGWLRLHPPGSVQTRFEYSRDPP